MKEPFIPKSTICEMMPLSKRIEFFRRILPTTTILPGRTGLPVGWPVYVPAEKGK